METASLPIATPTADRPPRRLLRRLLWVWAVFWLLMLVTGSQEYMWTGGHRLWQPVVDNGTAALAATGLAAWQMRRARRFDRLLNQPLRWFVHMWAWMPLQLIGFVAVMYAMRFAFYTLVGIPVRHGPWLEVLTYETTRFVLFFGLLGGVHFGLRSYEGWAAERLRAERQAHEMRQAQLAQLTQQLQPHFLFNALNTISSLIHDDPDMADRLLTRLASLLRAATDASQRPEHALRDELRLLESYAEIMVCRFADRVELAWAIGDGLGDCTVPTLGLQPLLENCFRHVVEQRSARTRIAIRAQRFDDVLRVEIENDGDIVPMPERRGVGLGNLERRLESLYGSRGRLELIPRPEGGLVARMEVPCAP